MYIFQQSGSLSSHSLRRTSSNNQALFPHTPSDVHLPTIRLSFLTLPQTYIFQQSGSLSSHSLRRTSSNNQALFPHTPSDVHLPTIRLSFLNTSSDTSRPPRSGEEEKGQYEFVSRQQMERGIRNNQYVEHGYFSGHYYGTSIRSIRSITDSRRTCVLVLIPSVSTPPPPTHTHTTYSGTSE